MSTRNRFFCTGDHSQFVSAAMITVFFMTSSCLMAQSSGEPKWSWTGWGGGGFFWSAAFDPGNADVLYMGGDVLGIYKSVDRGTTWKLINRGLQDYGVYSLAVSKSDPKTVYMMSCNGMARSDDGGESWNPLPETLNNKKKMSIHRHGSVRAVAIDPTDSKIVYAGSGQGELFKTFDAGKTWSKLDYYSAVKTDENEGPKPAQGNGFLWFNIEARKDDWNHHGRIEKFINQNGEDWSKYGRMTAKVYTRPGTPKLNVSLVVQTGNGWAWQESPATVLLPGKWTDVSFDLVGLKESDSVRMIHLVFRANGAEYQGEIGIDRIALIPKDGKQDRVLGDWEDPKNLEGWQATKSQDGNFSKGIRSSFGAKPQASGPIASVVVSEIDPKRIFVAHRKTGLFRSVDAGKTWTHPDTPSNTSHVAFCPKNVDTVYGAFEKDGIWKSTDGGVTWAKTGEMKPAGYGVREIAIDPRDPKTIHFIAVNGWSGCYGVSRDGGTTWTTSKRWTRDRLSNPSIITDLAKDPGGELSAPTNLAMSPTEPDVLFISANWTNILSTDGGKTWKQRDQGADITCFHDLRFVGDSAFAVAMDEGLFRTDDNGKSWSLLNPKKYEEGVSGHQWRVNVRKKEDGQIRVVTTVSAWRGAKEYPPAVLVSEDGGKTFKRGVGLPDYLPRANTMWGEGAARALATDPKNPEIMYIGIDGDPENGKSGGGIFKSEDGGLNWKQLPNQPGSRRGFYGLVIDPTDSKRIFWGAGGDNAGVWFTENGGESWKKAPVNEWVFNMEAAPSGTIYAGGNNLWESRDHGKTWKKLTDLKIGGVVLGIAVDPEDEKRIWISSITWGEGNRGGIFRSLDGGKTWSEITGDIPYKKPMILRYNPATRELWALGVGAFKTKQ